MSRFASLSIVFALLAPIALADDSFDLRALMNRKPGVGASYRVTETEHGTMEQKVSRNGQAMPPQKRETQPAQTYLEEVEAVGADGEPTRTKRTYESFKDETGKDVPVAGVIAVITRTEGPTPTVTFAKAEGSPPLPPAVEADLDRDAQNQRQKNEKHITEAQIHEVMFPAEAQAKGATWTVDMARAAPLLGMDVADLDLPQCTGNGSIDGVEEKDGKTWVKAKVAMTLMLKRMQGQPLPTPTPMTFTLTFGLTQEESVEREFDMVQHLDLTMAPAPGMSANVLVHNERTERRAAP
jgi:hypothetical protein